MSKKAITIIASEDTYQNLSTFTDIDDLNKTVRQYKERFKLNKNTVRVLDALQRYSAKFKGVSFRTKNNIASDLSVSRRTVIRACKTLESLGIIKQYDMKRKSDMKQTSNAIVIQPIEDIVTQDTDKNVQKCHSNKTTSISLKQNKKERKDNGWTGRILDGQFVSSNIPSEFVNVVSTFFGQADQVYHLWSRLTLATRKNGSESLILSHMNIYLKTFKESIYRLKNDKIKGEFYGYIYKVWERTTQMLVMQQNARTGLYYDWLTE